jgi:hypothetical protein
MTLQKKASRRNSNDSMQHPRRNPLHTAKTTGGKSHHERFKH